MIRVNDNLSIPEEEIVFEMSRGGGPGGQKVNKTSSRITLIFDVASSPSLSDEERRMLLEKLSHRLTGEGILRITVQSERSQLANRRLALERFQSLLSRALAKRKTRRPTRPTLGAKKRRLKEKKRRGDIKRDRGRKDWD